MEVGIGLKSGHALWWDPHCNLNITLFQGGQAGAVFRDKLVRDLVQVGWALVLSHTLWRPGIIRIALQDNGLLGLPRLKDEWASTHGVANIVGTKLHHRCWPLNR